MSLGARTGFAVVVLVAAASLARAGGPVEPSASRDPDIPPLTTEVWREPTVPAELSWQILAIPERLVELAFAPIGFAVAGIERYRLDRRLYDLLRNDAGTIVFTPRVKLSAGDGLGLGGKLSFKGFTGQGSKILFGGLGRLNGDYDAVSEWKQSLAFLEGREVAVRAEYELDQDLPYYGIGDETDERHLLTERSLSIVASGAVFGRGATDLRGIAELGYLRSELSAGVPGAGSTSIPVGEDDLPPPPGFGVVVDFARVGMVLLYDTRDTEGKTRTGSLHQIHGSLSSSVDDSELAGASLTANSDWYFQLLPRFRVLVLSIGAGGSTRLDSDDEIPVHELITLGRKNHLRGYSRARFRDRLGAWGSAEYRYPIWEYQSSGVALMSTFFVDVATFDDNFAGLVDGDLLYDGGVGLRGEHENHFVFFFELGVSPEGPEFGFSLGKEL